MPDYQNISSLGKGGFAEVWSCMRNSDGAMFAKKILFSTANALTVERFQQEVRILSKLDHPNIIKVIDSQLDAEPYWYIMPKYRVSLRDELPSVIGNAARTKKIFDSVLDGLEYAHREGIIHRDIKPQNIMMNGDDDLVVTDFGIGRILDAEGDRVTHSGQSMGSSTYASPEQLSDAKHVDAKSDIYNLGRMLYELHTGRLNSVVQDLARMPPNFAPIVERCTKFNPKERYQSVTELKDAWRSANESSSVDGGVGEAKRLITELTISPNERNKVERLFHLLVQNLRNDDLVREAMMSVPIESVSAMLNINADKLREIVRSFVGHVLSQNWGYTYHDKIGIRCGNLYIAANDPQVRAELLFCNLIIGARNKRYSVLEILAQLLQSVRSPLEVLAVQERLKSTTKELRLEAGKWLELDGLDPKISAIFRA